MKLIRITTEDRNANFSNDFNEDIIIEKDSQICVNNVSMEVVISELEISGVNDNIYWKFLVGGTERRITLNHTPEDAPYNQNNFPILLKDITDKLNASLSPVGVEIGRQFRCSVNSQNKISIENRQADYTDKGQMFLDNVPVKVLPVAGGVAQAVIEMDLTATGAICNQKPTENSRTDNFSMTYGNHSVTKGCGIFRVKIKNMVDNSADVNKQGFIIGVSDVSPSSYIDSRDMIDTDMDYAIHCSRTDSQYATIINGVRTVTATNIGFVADNDATNDILEVQISQGRLKLIVYQNGVVNPVVLNDVPYDNNTPYYPFIVMRGDVNTEAIIKKMTTDPYYDTPLGIIDITEIYGANPPRGNSGNLNAYIRFDEGGDNDVSQFLGYTNNRSPESGVQQLRQLNFVGENKFSYTDLSDAFVVMMDNIKLMSYDGYNKNNTGGGRQNIICIIPRSDSDKSVLYEPNNNNWLDIDNADKLTLRQVRARILKNDLTPLITNGLSTITFFIRPKTEH